MLVRSAQDCLIHRNPLSTDVVGSEEARRMRGSITTYKESLTRIADGILDAADEPHGPQALAAEGEESPRRFPRRSLPRVSPPPGSPIANGVDSGRQDEGNAEVSPNRWQIHISQQKPHPMGNHSSKVNVPKQDGISNGAIQTQEHDAVKRNMELTYANSQGNGQEHPGLFQETNISLAAVKVSLEAEIKQLREQLDQEHESALLLKQKLQEECQLNESYQSELNDLKMDKKRSSIELKELQKDLNKKITELGQLEAELRKRDMEQEHNIPMENAKSMIMTLEKENAKLKIEKDELEKNMKLCMKSSVENTVDSEDTENMALSKRKLEEALEETCTERDKALQELARLKQHILEKELEDSDKMDEDSKMIEELQANCQHQITHISQLEKALKHEIEKKEEFMKLKNDELHKSNEAIIDLMQKLANCRSIVDSKNVELLNLETALGQYYAESEAKERLAKDLAMVREEAAKFSDSLKAANNELEISSREKDEMIAKLTQTERTVSEGKHFIRKLEEDNAKLCRALEQSMTTVNRMSLDSDNCVDRRIVIKLLVTYFQRNHSKEVLDLIVRMLGFTEEDKQRIGFAQHAAGKGIVRGMLGRTGRLVGGFLGGNSPETSSSSSDNQSFADLWVDFLLKETEDRERRESSEALGASRECHQHT
ncbi:golgin candidate 4-like isoform X2 [Musa acuminata AAA Group]|uniref:golgin candidate 4-like isoform X2 n=1 Tax=Musa acuminata AAA Group TaxID=214697 RepID=UPI0031D23DED